MRKTDDEVMTMAKHACQVLQIKPEIIFCRSHRRECVLNRHITWSVLLQAGAYQSQIARVFRMNHGTISTRVKKINYHAKIYPDIKNKLEMLKIAFNIKI